MIVFYLQYWKTAKDSFFDITNFWQKLQKENHLHYEV